MHIVMVAAENGALRGGKVGGMGDVLRDVPGYLVQRGHKVTVVTPGYRSLVSQNPFTAAGELQTVFCDDVVTVSVHRYHEVSTGVEHLVLDHELFSACGPGMIYCDDHYGPFATDAHKFTLFCAAVCQLVADQRLFALPDVLHLHDWHTAMIAVLRRFDPDFCQLQRIRTVFTIHNLSLQGIRPLGSDDSSLLSWFPALSTDLSLIVDPRYADCINLMRCGLNLSDCVHAVSPGYVAEIVQPSNPEHGFIGGEGLEADLQLLQREGRLIGILNGCEYPDTTPAAVTKVDLLRQIQAQLANWSGGKQWIPSAHLYAYVRTIEWLRSRKPFRLRLVSVGRLTAQKVSLLRHELAGADASSKPALHQILEGMAEGVFILLGSGDSELESFMCGTMRRYPNFLYLQGFSEALATSLYSAGDLFLMPSSFEPCGISQMLAMRGGTPCIVHHVGGLKNTVTDGVNGFAFSGDSVDGQCRAMVQRTHEACEIASAGTVIWQQIRGAAANIRFSWDESTAKYIQHLYQTKD